MTFQDFLFILVFIIIFSFIFSLLFMSVDELEDIAYKMILFSFFMFLVPLFYVLVSGFWLD